MKTRPPLWYAHRNVAQHNLSNCTACKAAGRQRVDLSLAQFLAGCRLDPCPFVKGFDCQPGSTDRHCAARGSQGVDLRLHISTITHHTVKCSRVYEWETEVDMANAYRAAGNVARVQGIDLGLHVLWQLVHLVLLVGALELPVPRAPAQEAGLLLELLQQGRHLVGQPK